MTHFIPPRLYIGKETTRGTKRTPHVPFVPLVPLVVSDLFPLINAECADTLVQVRSFNSEDACGPGHIPVRLFERF